MLHVGAPMIYCGDEAGMWDADDPDDRKPVVQRDRDYDIEDDHPFRHDRPPPFASTRIRSRPIKISSLSAVRTRS